jgi:threonyl-tRNA synthetase
MATTEDAVSAQPASTELMDLPTNENSPSLFKIRHTTAHIMAMAVQTLFSEAQVGET